MSDKLFAEAIKKATEAANVAGDKWVSEHTVPRYSIHSQDLFTGEKGPAIDYVLDICGGAYIELKDKRTRFAKYLKSISKWPQIWSVDIEHKYRGRQEMGLNESCIHAAYDILTKEYGITGLRFKSYID